MVCAATFKQARIPIHAAPANSITAHNRAKVSTRPAVKVIPAKTRMAVPTTPSTDRLSRSRGSAKAPNSAPSPKQPSSTPYPLAPYGRAMIGSSASMATADTLNVPVRSSTDFASALRAHR